MKIFLLPGLGFDCRIFRNIDFQDFEVEELVWIDPIKNEPIRDYAKRIGEKIIKHTEKSIIIGHSFGGIIAQEIASLTSSVQKLILISTIKSRAELPFQFRIIAPLGLHHFFTKWFCNKTYWLWAKAHDFVTREDQNLLLSMVNRNSDQYLQWALKNLSKWRSKGHPENLRIFQIHGSKDKTFPIRRIRKPDLVVPGGSHMLVYKTPESIREALLKELNHE